MAPTSVVSNWLNEAARFAPALGSSASPSLRPSAVCRALGLSPPDVVITSYALLRIDNDKLSELEWSG